MHDPRARPGDAGLERHPVQVTTPAKRSQERAAPPERSWLACPATFSQRYWTLVTSFLPGATDTALLRAALCSGDEVGRAWNDWSCSVGDPVRALGNDPRYTKVLVPLL